MFEYERSLPLGFEEYSTIKKDSCAIKDVSFTSPIHGKVPAYLVVPNEAGSLPAVIFMPPLLFNNL